MPNSSRENEIECEYYKREGETKAMTEDMQSFSTNGITLFFQLDKKNMSETAQEADKCLK